MHFQNWRMKMQQLENLSTLEIVEYTNKVILEIEKKFPDREYSEDSN